MFPADKKVLIVDDDKLMRDTLQSIVTKFGLKKIIAVDNVNDAKRLLVAAHDENDPFHLVLCDHHMPGNSGLDFINYVRMSLRFRELPFITITSDSQRSVILPYISAGSDSFIVKPVNDIDLQNKITQVWTKRGIIDK